MPEKKTFPQSYSLYQVVARLFGHEDNKGLNSDNARPCLEFILEQILRGDGPQAYFNGQRVSSTEEEKRAAIIERSLTVQEGYIKFLAFRREEQDKQEQAKVLEINSDGWFVYIERLRKEIADAKETPTDESWDEVFVRSGYHPQDRVEEMKEHLLGLDKVDKKKRLLSYTDQAAAIKKGEADYIEEVEVILTQYEKYPFWVGRPEPAQIKTQSPFERAMRDGIIKELVAGKGAGRRPKAEAILAKLDPIIENKSILGKRTSEANYRRWITQEAKKLGMESNRGAKPKEKNARRHKT